MLLYLYSGVQSFLLTVKLKKKKPYLSRSAHLERTESVSVTDKQSKWPTGTGGAPSVPAYPDNPRTHGVP